MSEIRLSIIIPTLGRLTLARTLSGISRQILQRGDQVLLIADGLSPAAIAIWERSGLPGEAITLTSGPHGDWGNTAKREALRRVTGTHVVYIDDDDLHVPGAFAAIRRGVQWDTRGFHIFKMRYVEGKHPGGVLWHQPELVPDNVGTPMFVHPADCVLGAWGTDYRSDFEFMRSTAQANPDRRIHWHDHVIAEIYQDPTRVPQLTE